MNDYVGGGARCATVAAPMTDDERQPWEDALEAYQRAFESEYQEGKAELARGESEQTVEVDDPWFIDVLRDMIVDADTVLTPSGRFGQAGRDAALARRRGTGEAHLLLVEGPDHHDAKGKGWCRWRVTFDAPEVATP